MGRLLYALTVCAFLAAQTVAGAAPGDDIYARPGLIAHASDGAQLNFNCMGSGSPTVVIDSGWEDWSPDWVLVQPPIAKFTRVCSYDRAGLGFSSVGPMPRTSVRIAEELHSALHSAHIGGPYILVGNAFGGDPVRTFADLYTADLAGLVLVEADATDLEPKAMQDADHAGNARVIARLRPCRDAVAAKQPLPCDRQFFRGLPEAEWSPELNAKLLQIAQTKVALYDAALSEMEEMAWDEAWLTQHVRYLGSRPVRVITTGNHAVSHLPARDANDPKHIEYEHAITLAQARWLSLSSDAKQIFPPHSSEYVGFDDPNAIIDAVHDVYTRAVRRATDSSGSEQPRRLDTFRFVRPHPSPSK